MKIAILGSAPSSIGKAPFGDPSWEIWACSPGAYPRLTRIDEFWEVHRWEPGVIGKPETQKPWFSPEYVQWLKTVPPKVWVADADAQKDIGYPRAQMLPVQRLVDKYGHYCWTSSVAYMLAMATDKIQERMAVVAATKAAYAEEMKKRKKVKAPVLDPIGVEEQFVIGLWGVDMAANEELYTSQRASCQHFIQLITKLGIDVFIPPESDLPTPPPMYGVSETSHRAIKWTERKRELEARLAMANAQARGAHEQGLFIMGALDDLDYHFKMWMHQGEDTTSMQFDRIFPIVSAEKVMDPASAAAQRVTAAPESNDDITKRIERHRDIVTAESALGRATPRSPRRQEKKRSSRRRS